MMNYHVSQQAIANIMAVPDERVQAAAAESCMCDGLPKGSERNRKRSKRTSAYNHC
jgi:hypothetical protein